MKVEEYLSYLLGQKITVKKIAACCYLEKKGFQFLNHFGFQNAEDLARQERKKNVSKKADRNLQTRKSNK